VKRMAKIIGTTLLFGLLATLAGCSSLEVNYDYDMNVDWSHYQTYAWMGGNSSASSVSAGAVVDSGLLDQRIRKSIEWEMEQRNISTSDNPDVLVVYHIGSEEKLQVTDWGYRYSDYYWGYGGRQIDVYEFTTGTLVIDIIDAETENLIWRGNGTKVIDTTQRSPEEMQERIDNVVNKIMASFPPEG